MRVLSERLSSQIRENPIGLRWDNLSIIIIIAID